MKASQTQGSLCTPRERQAGQPQGGEGPNLPTERRPCDRLGPFVPGLSGACGLHVG